MTAAERILSKALVGSNLDTRRWSEIQAGLRDRSFFMAQVEDARILHAARQGIGDMLQGGKSQSEVRRDIRSVLEKIRYDPDKGLGENEQSRRGTIKDLLTKRRLDVMIETNVQQARGYADHLRATTDGALRAFPAYELVRVKQRRKTRNWEERWANAARDVGYEGVARGAKIALKTSPIWTRLSRFGNPFPPFDFNSGMGLDDVPRSECIRIGLIDRDTPPQKPPEVHFNGSLHAELPYLRGDSDEARDLHKKFGDQIVIKNGLVRWEGELIHDTISGKRKNASLGCCTEEFIKKASSVMDPDVVEMFKGRQVSLSHQFFVEHGNRHLDPNEPFEHLIQEEFDLLPTLWRSPSRILSTRDPNRAQVELDTLDGGMIVAIIDCRNGLKSIQKRKGLHGSTS